MVAVSLPVPSPRETRTPIARTSAGLERKYDGDSATPSMVRAEILDTTMRLDPVTTD